MDGRGGRGGDRADHRRRAGGFEHQPAPDRHRARDHPEPEPRHQPSGDRDAEREPVTGCPSDLAESPKGTPVTLAGQAGILITITGADGHTRYTGPTDFKTNYSELKELRQVQDFEGMVQWALGLSHSGCYAYTFLTNPTRLVIYIQQ